MPAEPDPYFRPDRPMNLLPAEARYSRDPLFKTLVDAIYHCIGAGGLTPTEVREAAFLASCKYETTHVRPILFDTHTGSLHFEHPSGR